MLSRILDRLCPTDDDEADTCLFFAMVALIVLVCVVAYLAKPLLVFSTF